jgi:hypothetical protein
MPISFPMSLRPISVTQGSRQIVNSIFETKFQAIYYESRTPVVSLPAACDSIRNIRLILMPSMVNAETERAAEVQLSLYNWGGLE